MNFHFLLIKCKYNFSYHFVPKAIIDERKLKLKDRFESAKTIVGTKENHCYQPIDNEMMNVKMFSADETSRRVRLIKKIKAGENDKAKVLVETDKATQAENQVRVQRKLRERATRINQMNTSSNTEETALKKTKVTRKTL